MVERIASELSALDAETDLEPNPSLATGLAGLALFFAYLPPELDNYYSKDRAADMIGRAVRSPNLAELGYCL